VHALDYMVQGRLIRIV